MDLPSWFDSDNVVHLTCRYHVLQAVGDTASYPGGFPAALADRFDVAREQTAETGITYRDFLLTWNRLVRHYNPA